jgi:carbon storage regulator
MLVMRRRAGETFMIGEGIEIEILAINGARVKLGIVAPDSVVIQRKETQITREENISAARNVGQEDISALLSKVAFPTGGAPVKNLTGATILTSKAV